jgi:hypothetical protein
MGHLRRRLELGEAQCFRQDADGVLWFKGHLVVLKDFELYRKIMDEAHYLWYSIHPGTNKMYQDLKKIFFLWMRMKREIVRYVSECDTCRRVKTDHLRPTRNLQPFSIPEWKWENIYMDFIVGLPRTSCGYNSLWVIVDCLIKSAHFIPLSTIYRSHIMPSSTYHSLSPIMASRRPLSLIEDLSLLLAFGSNYMHVWAPSHPKLRASSSN